jgi:ATP-dependent Clp protease ATP-binding subunit ClpC
MMDFAREAFKPELLNRIDDIVVFRKLTRDDVLKILEIEVVKVQDRLKRKGIDLQLTQPAKDLLIEKGYDPANGARPLRRAIERYLEDPLAEELLRGNINKNETVEVGADDDHLTFEQLAGTSGWLLRPDAHRAGCLSALIPGLYHQ